MDQPGQKGLLSAAILAGGRARRFGGRDKSALLIDDVPILHRQIGVLREVADHLLIVANARERYAASGVQIVADRIAAAGALGGIYTAIVASPGELALVVACDMPFLTAPFLRYLATVAADADVAIPRTADGYQPLCACYRRTCSEPIRRRIEAGALTVVDCLADLHVRTISPDEIAPYDADGTLFFNINSPDDYTRACEMSARQRIVVHRHG